MINRLERFLLYLLLCGVGFPLAAQQYGYVQYNADSDAPFEQVSSVIQDAEGFMWIASENGLYRFDGIHFDLYSLHTQSQFIHRLRTNANDLLFVNDLSIYQIDQLGTRPEVNIRLEGSINEVDSLPFYPNDFLIAKNKDLWVSQSNHSIGHLQGKTFTAHRFSKSEKAQKLAIQEDSQGGIWALSPLDGLFFFDAAQQAFQKVLDIQSAKSLLIHQDRLLLGNESLHVYTINGNRLLRNKKMELNEGPITAIHVDQDGQYLIGTQTGKLLRYSNLDRSPQAIYGGNEAHRVEEIKVQP